MSATGVVPFLIAEVGDHAYTWELPGSDFGDYVFETGDDPADTYGEDGPRIRKRWQLVEVVELPGRELDGAE